MTLDYRSTSETAVTDPVVVTELTKFSSILIAQQWCQTLCEIEGIEPDILRDSCAEAYQHLPAQSQLYRLGAEYARLDSAYRTFNRVWRFGFGALGVGLCALIVGVALTQSAIKIIAIIYGYLLVAAPACYLSVFFVHRRKGVVGVPAARSRAKADLDRRLRAEIEKEIWIKVEPVFVPPEIDDVLLGDGANLSSRAQPHQRIATQSHAAVELHMLRTGGATVGVTGERGIGKSEMLRSFSEPVESKTTPAGGGTIGVYVAVPAAFGAPEFLRYLLRKLIMAIPGHRSNIELERIRRKYYLLAGIMASIAGVVVALSGYSGVFDGWRYTTDWAWLAVGAPSLSFLAISYTVAVVWLTPRISLGQDARRSAALETQRKRSRRHARLLMTRLQYAETVVRGSEGSATVGKLALKRSAQRSLSELPLTEADLVGEFAELTRSLERAGYRIVITIDEMDKLEAGQRTEDFLNAIKQIFATQSCSFAISISTSAWATFSQRGHNIRDVLDSSLDAIEAVESLTFVEARSMIRKRREEMTDSQILFCLAMSGGLPREFMRYARLLAKINGNLGGTSKLDVAVRAVLKDVYGDLLTAVTQDISSWASD